MRRFIVFFGELMAAFLYVGHPMPVMAQQDVITTVVGGGPNSMPAIDANLSSPVAVAVDTSGNYYIAVLLQNRVFKVNPSGTLTVVAGSGLPGYSGDGVVGGAANAMLNSPQGVATDATGNVFIADTNNFVIRKVDTTGTISTIAGIAGSCTFDGDTTTDGKPATQHSLCFPVGLAVDSSANLFIGDSNNCRVREVSGTSITTVAGNGTCGFSGDTGTATAAELNQPSGIAVDSSGNLFIGDTANYVIRKVTAATKKIVTVAGTPGIQGFSGDGAKATLATIATVLELSVNSAGTTVWISEYNNWRIRKFTVGGNINTVAGSGCAGFSGDGGPSISACLYYPQGVAVDSSGNIFIADTYNERIRKVDITGNINTVAGNGSTTQPTPANNVPALGVILNSPFGVIGDPAGNIFIGDTNNSMVRELLQSTGNVDFFAGDGTFGFGGDGGPAINAQLFYPNGVARDSSGNVYIADTDNDVIRKVDLAGNISTIAGVPQVCGYSGDGGSAASAQLCGPMGVFVDASGNVFIADSGNSVIREVINGTINTVAGTGLYGYIGDGGPATGAKLSNPAGVSTDAAGNIYIADTYNGRIRVVNALTKTINTVAGNGACAFTGDGPALQNSLCYPQSVTVDANGNLFVSDTQNNRLRWVDLGGTMTTFAGGGSFSFGGDGGVATSASLALPAGLFEDSLGNFLVADQANFRIRAISAFAALNRSTSSLTFGLQNVNSTSSPQRVTLSAVGPLTISSITTSGDFSESDNCGTLSNGATCTLYVFFTPKASGTRTGTIAINDNGFFSSAQTLSVTGTGAAMSATPNPLPFGSQPVKTTSVTKTVTVKNNGSTSVTMGTITLTQATDFAITTDNCPSSGSALAAKATCALSLTFTPQSTGAKKSTLVINDSDPTSPQIVGLTGTGTSSVSFTPNTVSFATQVLNTTSAPTSVTLTNGTGTTLTLGNPALSTTGDFALATTGTTCTNSLVIPTSGTCLIKVTFKPTVIGARAGLLSVADSDATSPQTVPLSGTGTAIKFTPAAINFGNVAKGTQVGTAVTISNVGTSTVILTNVTLTGTNSSDFSIPYGNPPCGGSIAAGGTCSITVYFKPSITGVEKAIYSVFDNGGGSPQKLSLSGTGQ